MALGSNRRHHRDGPPDRVLRQMLAQLEAEGLAVEAVGPLVVSRPLGPSHRRYANSAAVVSTLLEPAALLALLKKIERQAGRRSRGQRWSARVLDLDIILWDGGPYHDRSLTIPHREFRHRGFVLGPAAAIAGDWRDPLSGLSVRQLAHRLTAPRPLT